MEKMKPGQYTQFPISPASAREKWGKTMLSLFFLCFPALAQIGVDVWTADNGLPQNIIRAICQTPEGYLWLATYDGLVRFDGVRFTTHNRSNTPGINGNRFGSLFCTADGDFWAGTEGSGITRYHQGRFTTFTTQDGLPSDNVSAVSADYQGTIWVLAPVTLTRWDAAGRRFVPQAGEGSTYSDALSPNGLTGFWRIDDSTLNLFSFGRRLRYSLPPSWPHAKGFAVGEDLNHHVWLASGTGRLAQLVDGHWLMTSSTTTYRDSHGNVWHGEITWKAGSGMLRYLYLPPGVQPDRIAYNTFFEDREGNIWLSTDGQGLYRLRTNQTIRVFSKEEGLPDRNVYPICSGRDGSVWIGTWSGGLCRFRQGKFTTYTTANGLASNRIHAIFEDRDGVLWVAAENGLRRLRNGRFEAIDAQLTPPPETTIRAIHQDPDGVIWLGTGEGLFRLEDGKRSVLTKRDGLATNDIRVIVNGRNANLWVAGYGGLSSIQHGQVRSWTERDGLGSAVIRSLYEDADGILWVGTYDAGLARFENGRFTRYTVREGLFNNGVFKILEDGRGYFWMSSNRGIYRVSKQQLNDVARGKSKGVTSISYGKRDGMRNIECNGGSGVNAITQYGRFWFPTQDGVAVLDPETLPTNQKPPPVVIESCVIDQQNPERYTQSPISPGPVRVKPGQQNIEIQYTALSLIDSERIQFKYRMEELDRDWVDAGTRRTAYYPHLPPGNYRFTVTAAHADGVWNEHVADLAIVVLPAFYQTWWFASLLSTLAAALLWFAYRYRLSHVEQARAAQQAFSRQLIASQENERKRIAAELHDSLGQRLVIIKNLALLLLQNRSGTPTFNGTQREQIEQISGGASQAIHEVREIAHDLRPYRLDRLGLTSALRAMIDTAADASLIAFVVEVDGIDGLLPKPAEINFYRIVQECVSNILKHSEAKQATVRILRTEKGLTLTVQDDGKGFSRDSGDADPRQGFGLTGISERARLLGGKAAIHSAPGQGTTVIIEIHSEGFAHER
jgi:signal transduction histidine kinase/streptogramin lyase